ncbi:MAG: glycosyltransferase family 2 protein [Candidatus Omnitrophica bacterium]|nr:glycosyltransferase family 2 protein [Candidatus Omnitrophota bacterium]
MDISIVIPVYNEAGNLPLLVKGITRNLGSLGRSYEIIFVDDGSQDDSCAVLKELKKSNAPMKIIKLRRNFGQTQAIVAGFDNAEGDIIVTMDADLQNDPDDIPALIAKLGEGYDIVSGWRDKRKDPFFSRKLPSFCANKLISFLTGVKLHDYGCTLKAYRKDVIRNMRLYGEMHRFIPAIASFSGIKLAEMRVRHHNRGYGVSKYGISRTLMVLLDLITVKFFLSYSKNPMRLFGLVGLVSIFLGCAFFAVAIVMKCMKVLYITGNPLFYMSILLEMVGAQCILMGILGEMNVRIYYELLNKQTYSVEEKT